MHLNTKKMAELTINKSQIELLYYFYDKYEVDLELKNNNSFFFEIEAWDGDVFDKYYREKEDEYGNIIGYQLSNIRFGGLLEIDHTEEEIEYLKELGITEEFVQKTFYQQHKDPFVFEELDKYQDWQRISISIKIIVDETDYETDYADVIDEKQLKLL